MQKISNAAMAGSGFVPSKFTPDLYEDLMLRISGTQAAGQFASIGEIGRVRYKEHGAPVVDCDFDMLHFANEVLGGDAEISGTTPEANGGVFNYSVVIPRGYRDGNVHLITQADEPSFQLDYYANAVAHIASATVQLSGRPREAGTQKYRLKITQRDFVYGGSQTPVEQIYEENVLALFFDRSGAGPNQAVTKANYPVSANWSELTVKKDGKIIADDTIGALQAASNYDNRIESSYTRLFEVRCVDPAVDFTEALSDRIEVLPRITGAMTVRCLILSADFTDDKYDTTVGGSAQVLRQKLDRKQSQGKLRVGRIAEKLISTT